MERDPNVQMKPVRSSNLDAVGYDAVKHVLYVAFKNGTQYGYQNVPEETYQAFMNAESLGKFFHASIRNGFPFAKI